MTNFTNQNRRALRRVIYADMHGNYYAEPGSDGYQAGNRLARYELAERGETVSDNMQGNTSATDSQGHKIVLERFDMLLDWLRDLKPNDRSEQDRYWAIVITDVEKAKAVFAQCVGGETQ